MQKQVLLEGPGSIETINSNEMHGEKKDWLSSVRTAQLNDQIVAYHAIICSLSITYMLSSMQWSHLLLMMLMLKAGLVPSAVSILFHSQHASA